MAAFVAKQMVGNKLSAVKGEFRIFNIEHAELQLMLMISSILLFDEIHVKSFTAFASIMLKSLLKLSPRHCALSSVYNFNDFRVSMIKI